MSSRFIYSEENLPPVFISSMRPRRRYGFFKFLFDCVMVLLTHGIWLIWIFVREMRAR